MPKDKYMSFMDLLFRNQQKWDYEFGVPSPDGVHAALLDLAGGIRHERRCRQQAASPPPPMTTPSARWARTAVAKYKINATPTFVINGKGGRL